VEQRAEKTQNVAAAATEDQPLSRSSSGEAWWRARARTVAQGFSGVSGVARAAHVTPAVAAIVLDRA